MKGDLSENGELTPSIVPEIGSLGCKKKNYPCEKSRNEERMEGEMPKVICPPPTLFSLVHRNVPHMSDPSNKR
eukprot:13954469-Ditylum_brightwellii.AAC.1